MMRIFGITLPDGKQIQYSMTVLHGIGLSRAQALCKEAGVDPVKKTKDLSESEEKKLRDVVEALTLEGDLKRSVSQNIKRLMDIDSYRGGRHSRHLPARGQRTKTNSRTRRGNKRVTMGSGKK
ncbi:MAG: 30S ribosomal protein S13 [Candidatus Pacebacteria bacterium]|nr:30S ribosomal protein S13 [Candidatus Paceibacterota bacterium]